MCLEVKSDYQKSSWLKSYLETNLGFWRLQNTPEKFFGTFQGVWGHAPRMESLRLAKMHFLLVVMAMK